MACTMSLISEKKGCASLPSFSCPQPSQIFRDVNGIIKNSLKMPGSRGRIGPGGVKGQRPNGGPKEATSPR